ncbi:MAG: hypothetical protein ACRBC3_14665 [Burkholderiaceae bacterium]
MKKFIIGALIATTATWAQADDFSDTLENAKQAYAEGDIGGAKEELAYASQLLGQMRAKQLESYLPEALDGWTRKENKSSSNAGAAMFGGGTAANVEYRRGKDRVKINLVTDSPMLASMGMLFNNPALAGTQGTMKRINRQKVLVKKNGAITAMIDKRIMVEVSGRAPAEDIEAYFKGIDIKGLKSY